eukprot:CAMPEP_0196576054 /NCGR_PEP_ID=MMETSP1081-20130531/5410_1 /TAXON_ID=36882 /ORGANISM="Pyramimonas amylifera, Strain CCMP720" /LENGTH=53 /DNA_ID=CAMNT_0041894553 /DNA_START=748 /DNA_END=909 /DNA_ORIENTATION=+
MATTTASQSSSPPPSSCTPVTAPEWERVRPEAVPITTLAPFASAAVIILVVSS